MATVTLGGRADADARPGLPNRTLRTDIQALRAVAVMSVVLFHLWPNRLPGGFVGVDVFFVISGFLITGHLVREIEQTGRLRLARFWAARARRLLPASLLTLLLTALAVVVLVPRSLWDQFLAEVIASATYAQNWLLASNAVDYLATDNVPSPAQHFWSLSVEEQFYVGVPLLLLLAVALGRLVGAGRTRPLVVTLVAVTLASFAYCLHLTASEPGIAYFSTFTRVWEFGLGALASFAVPATRGLARRRLAAQTVVTIAGAVAIVVSFFLIDADTPFPGHAALLPVLGSVVIIRWGGATIASTVGALQPAAVLGRISYALYLWHWPLIVLFPFVTYQSLSSVDKLLILVLSVAIAWLSTRLVEEPLRFTVARRMRPRSVLLVAVAMMIPLLVVTVAGKVVVDRDRVGQASERERVLAQMPACLGAASMDPDSPGCVNPALDDIVVPAPVDALHDRTAHEGCGVGVNDTGFLSCTIGPKTGYDLRIAAVGDSHSRTLMPAYEWMAKKYNWRIDMANRAACYWTTAENDSDRTAVAEECQNWRSDVADFLRRPGRFDAIITTHASAITIKPRPGLSYEETAVRGMVEAWNETPADVPIVAILDNPQAVEGNTQCVEQFGISDPGRCAARRSWALRRFDGSAEAVARVDRAHLVDMTAFYCRQKICPSVIGGVMVYRDRTHVTATWVTTLAPYLGREVAAMLRDKGVL